MTKTGVEKFEKVALEPSVWLTFQDHGYHRKAFRIEKPNVRKNERPKSEIFYLHFVEEIYFAALCTISRKSVLNAFQYFHRLLQ